MARLVLFGSPLSPFVQKVIRALKWKQLAFDLVQPRGIADFKKWNPQVKKMPVLQVDGERIYDSTFILRRLDELASGPPLFSADAGEAAAQHLLEDWADESLYWHVMALRWTLANASASADQLLSQLSFPKWLQPLLKWLLTQKITRQARAQGFARLPAALLVRELELRLDDLVAVLGRKPFFYADRLSAADIAVMSQLTFGGLGTTPEVTRAVEARPNLVEWCKRVEQTTGG